MLKEIRVEWSVYNFYVWVAIGPNRYLRAYVKKRHRRIYRDKDGPDVYGAYFESIPKRGGLLWLRYLPRTPKTIGVLAHEMGHAVMDMHTQRALVLDNMTDETFCYAIQHGIEEVLKGVRK